MTGQRAYSIYIGHIRDAIQHALEIVGEAAKRVPEDIRSLEPTIPWRTMAGMRDVIIHRYDEVNLMVVWSVVQSNLQEVLPRLERLQHLLELREDEEWESA